MYFIEVPMPTTRTTLHEDWKLCNGTNTALSTTKCFWFSIFLRYGRYFWFSSTFFSVLFADFYSFIPKFYFYLTCIRIPDYLTWLKAQLTNEEGPIVLNTYYHPIFFFVFVIFLCLDFSACRILWAVLQQSSIVANISRIVCNTRNSSTDFFIPNWLHF